MRNHTVNKPIKTSRSLVFLAKAEWVLAGLTLLLFFNTVWNGYGFDDEISVSENVYVQQGVKGIPEILTRPYVVLQGKGMEYRPVSQITYAIEKTIFGDNVGVSHFINALLFTAVVLLLFYCLEKVWLKNSAKAREWAFFICLLYAVHPVHTEVVDSLKNREEILSFIFALLWFISYRYYWEKGKIPALIGSGIFFLLSLMSKVVSLPFIFLGLLWLWWYENRRSIAFYVVSGITLLVIFGYLGIVYSQNTSRVTLDLENPLVTDYSLWARLGMSFDSLAFYARLLIVPYPLRFYYGYNMIPLQTIFVVKPFLVFMLCAGLAYYTWRKLKERKTEGYFVLSFFICMILFLNFFGAYTGIVSERALFQSSVFAIAMFVLLAEAIPARWRYGIFTGIAILFFGLTLQRNTQWKDTLTLMKHDIPYLEESTLANFFYANERINTAQKTEDTGMKAEHINEAEKYLEHTLRLSPKYADAYYTKGRIAQYYYDNLDAAIHYYETAYGYNTNPEHTLLFYELGRAYCMRGDYVKAKPVLTALCSIIPADTNALYFYARALFNTGEAEEGFAINRKLMQLYPQFSFGYLNEGWFFELSGDREQAAFYYQKAIDRGNRDTYLIDFLSDYYDKSGNYMAADAINHLRY